MGGKLDCHRTKGVTRMGQWEVNQIVTDCHRTKGVTRMGQWEVNQIVTEQKV